jgi:hypothetical protein
MEILAKVASALQGVFGPLARPAADECAVIQRQRKFTALSLARTFGPGFLQHPHATDEQLAQRAGHQGLAVTPQAIEQRHTPRWVAFLRALFVKATRADAARLQQVLSERRDVFRHTGRRDPRTKPGTFELLNDIERLEFC